MTFTTVLIVDGDLGFAFWLGRALDGAGFTALAAKDVPDALTLITQHRVSPQVLVLNTCLDHVTELISRVRRLARPPRVVAVLSDEPAGQLPKIDAAQRKPKEFSRASKAEWVRLIEQIAFG